MSTAGSVVRDGIQRLLAALGEGGQAAVRELLAVDPEVSSEEVAAALGELLKEAHRAGDPAATRVFGSATFLVHEARRDMRAAVASLVPNLDVGFRLADTAEKYAAVAEAAVRRVGEALSVGADDVALMIRIVGADCAYFAAKVSPPADRVGWLMGSLEMLTTPPEVASTVRLEADWTFRLASLSAAVVREILGSFAPDPAAIEGMLRRLAALTEAVIPADFSVAEQAKRSDAAGRALADLSYRSGSTGLAEERIDALLRRAAGPEERVAALLVRYQGLRAAARTTGLRQAIRAELDAVRGACRSRIGRLFARQQDVDVEGMMLEDDATDPSVTDADLFAAAERGKARLLLDQLSGEERPLAGDAAARALEIERAALAFAPFHAPSGGDPLLWRESRLVSEQSIGIATDDADQESRMALVVEAERICQAEGAGLGPAGRVAELSWVASALELDEALIEYVIPHHATHPARALHLLVVTRAGATRLRVALDDLLSPVTGRMAIDGMAPIDTSGLGDRVAQLRVAIARGDDASARDGLAVLHRRLIQPLLDAGIAPERFRRWVIVPHGPLHYVPFAALAAAGGPALIEQVALVVAPSASSWLHLVARPAGQVARFLGLANPTVPDELADLGEAERELHKIDGILSRLARKVLVGAEATEAAFRADAPGRELIHVAAHGEFPEDEAFHDHRIRLAAGDGHDGRVHADEIRAIDLAAARLVVLNICDGGLYRVGPGDEPYGLVAALLAAGSQNVLGTLWPIEDTSARVYITRFYRALLGGGPAAAAAAASRQAIADGASLAQWAGFVPVGPGRPFAAA